MERRRANDHEQHEHGESDERVDDSTDHLAQEQGEGRRGHRPGDQRDHDEVELVFPTVVVPALGLSPIPQHLGEQRLEVELLVGAENHHDDGNQQPHVLERPLLGRFGRVGLRRIARSARRDNT